MERKDDRFDDQQAAPTAASIAIFAFVAGLLFAGAYFFMPGNYRTTATVKSPTVAERPAPAPAPPVTTGQGGDTR